MTRSKELVLPIYLGLCIALGGASAGGYLANGILQAGALGLICWAFALPKASPFSPGERSLIWIVVGTYLLLALQFLPIPFQFWSMLGERATIAAFAERSGFEIAYPALSLMPHETLKSVVWTLPALAFILWMLRTRAFNTLHLATSLVLFTGLSILLGALQIGTGLESPYYLYDITNRGSTVGFFANSNHLATLLLIALPCTAAAVAALATRYPLQTYPLKIGGAGVVLVILAGIFVNGSLTGYALVLPVLFGAYVIQEKPAGLGRYTPFVLGVLLVGGITLAFLTEDGSAMLAGSSGLDPGDRRVMFANTIQASRDYGPLGAGVGSFREIYRQYQDPLAVTKTYVNHAHNDYLEVLLETGVLGAVLVLVFLVWWFWRAAKIWQVPKNSPFGKAATIVSGTILVHSLVDYPLRTAAISSIFAICLALMARRTDYEPFPRMSPN